MSNVPGSAGLWTCRWSPDGQYLAALTIANPRMMISVYTQATGVWQSLPATKEVVELEWSRDSQFIYYWAEMSLRKVRVSNGAVTILTDLTNYPVTQWVGVSPEGAPLLLHGTGAKRLYALKLGAR
jgi:Tol biopolymer transport system component